MRIGARNPRAPIALFELAVQLESALAACLLWLSEFSYMNFRASALRIFGLSPIALRSFRAMCLPIKAGADG
jgi:hypothetical protein